MSAPRPRKRRTDVLQVSPWARIATILVVLTGLLIALPNALPDKIVTRFPSFLPKSTVSLGLDLQGGSYLLLEAQLDQVQKDKAEAMIGDIRAAFRKAHIGYTDLVAQGDTVTVKVSDVARYDEAKKLVSDLNPTMSSSVQQICRVAAMCRFARRPRRDRCLRRP